MIKELLLLLLLLPPPHDRRDLARETMRARETLITELGEGRKSLVTVKGEITLREAKATTLAIVRSCERRLLLRQNRDVYY